MARKPFGPKRTGCCTQCGTAVYEILDTWKPPHPLAGEARRIGLMLDTGTQARFLLSDGSTVDLTFCLPCVEGLKFVDYGPLWQAVIDRNDLALAVAARSPAIRAHARATMAAVFPLAVLARARLSPDGLRILDRRGVEG